MLRRSPPCKRWHRMAPRIRKRASGHAGLWRSCNEAFADRFAGRGFRLRVPAAVKLEARTVNGGVVAKYSRNPSRGVALESINGSVDATFVAGLAADVRCKTMNGGVYTDYEISALPAQVSVEKTSTM